MIWYRTERELPQKKNISIVVKCIAFYFAMMPFDSFPMFGMGSLLKIFAIFPIIAILLLERRTKLILNRLTVAFLIYVFANAVTCIYSADMSSSLVELRRLAMNGVLILVVGGMYDKYNKDELEYLIKALIIGGMATVLLTFIFGDTSSAGRLTLSINGARQDQNYINGYMYFAFAFFINKIIGDKKFLYIIPSILLIVFTIMTGSRGAAIALIALGIIVFLYHMFDSGKIRLGVLLVFIAIIVIFVFGFDYIISFVPEEVTRRFTRDYINNYKGTNRIVLWAEIFKIFKNGSLFRKLFGFGYGAVAAVNKFNNAPAHNLWLDHLISGGIIGVLIMTYMHIVFVLEAWRQKNIVILASYIGLLTMCLTLSLTNYKPLWNCMMMIMILMNAKRNEMIKQAEVDEDADEELEINNFDINRSGNNSKEKP